MNAGDIIKEINGLNHDRLTYFVRCGYVKPVKVRRGTLYYNDFSESDRELIRKAWRYIVTFDMKVRSAFERAKRVNDDPQLPLFEEPRYTINRDDLI
jgi:hypothetical protein